jgi:hypothetical protein
MDMEERFAQLERLAEEYAVAHAQAEHLAEFRKAKKAILMREAEVSGVKTSAMQERDAYAHPDYVDLLKGLRSATERAVSCKWRLELARMRFEAWRSQQANRRAEMNLR